MPMLAPAAGRSCPPWLVEFVVRVHHIRFLSLVPVSSPGAKAKAQSYLRGAGLREGVIPDWSTFGGAGVEAPRLGAGSPPSLEALGQLEDPRSGLWGGRVRARGSCSIEATANPARDLQVHLRRREQRALSGEAASGEERPQWAGPAPWLGDQTAW